MTVRKIAQALTPQLAEALAASAYSTDPVSPALREHLEAYHLIDRHGDPTRLGLKVADFLTTH